jgi:predicted dehydrogenase
MPRNDKIPIAIVGLNYGRWIIESLLNEKAAGRYFRIGAICDLDSSRARAMAEKTGARTMTFEEVLADPDIPAIGLFTGPGGRAGFIRKIIRAGKDVMTTKPFELDVERAVDVLEEARSLGRVVHLNSPSPLTPPDLVQIEKWRTEHQLGSPVSCHAETYASYREQADGSWYDDPERCPVSPVFRIGIYMINDLVQMFGEPEAVQVLTSRIRTGRPTPDNAQMGILFKNGAIANVFASLCVDDGQRWADSLVLHFESGTIYRNVGPLVFGGGPEGTTTLKLLARRAGETKIETVRFETRSGQYQWEAFHNAIRGEKLETPVAEMACALRVIRAMARAEKSGKTERV